SFSVHLFDLHSFPTRRSSDLIGRQSMRSWFSDSLIAVAVLIGVLLLAAISVAGQATTYRAPRTGDGKPNLNGIWQALNTADWDRSEEHTSELQSRENLVCRLL